MKLFNIRTRKIGLPPGTLVTADDDQVYTSKITAFRHTPDQYEEKEISVDDIKAYDAYDGITWLNIDGLHTIDLIKTIGTVYGIHDLVLEDILNTAQRPKIDEHDAFFFIVLKMIYTTEDHTDIETEQVSLILKKGIVISFQEKEGDVFTGIRDRIRKGKGRIRTMGADYLVYALMDAIIDNYFIIMEQMGEEIETLENEVIENPQTETAAKIHALRRKVILLRRSIWPLREVINGFLRSEGDLIENTTTPFLRDLYDHTIQVVETIETFRDVLSGMLDLYLSSVSNRMNEIMKILTIISTLFIPLGFLAGIYGMNFKYMPELDLRWGYPALLIVMVSIIGGFLLFFKRKKWI